jgi:hypothetical protein
MELEASKSTPIKISTIINTNKPNKLPGLTLLITTPTIPNKLPGLTHF